MKYLILIIALLTSSCSTLKRQKVLGGIVGLVAVGSISASIGKELSPNPESDRLNQRLGMVTGGTLGFFLGMNAANYLWQDRSDIEAKNLTSLNSLIHKKEKLKIIRPKDIKRIRLETKLPPFIQGKIKEANVITYELESYEEQTEDGRKIIHEPHKAYEYVIEY